MLAKLPAYRDTKARCLPRYSWIQATGHRSRALRSFDYWLYRILHILFLLILKLEYGISCLGRVISMLWTIVALLLILWLLGMVSSYTLGGLIHILLVLAVIAVLVRIIQGRSPA